MDMNDIKEKIDEYIESRYVEGCLTGAMIYDKNERNKFLTNLYFLIIELEEYCTITIEDIEDMILVVLENPIILIDIDKEDIEYLVEKFIEYLSIGKKDEFLNKIKMPYFNILNL
ncbi:hypothetical protein Metvu_0594 [Methanocaldococcus vulcanius M7]|uniref:Uncharacterized protein n=1 Tax=Methanocaldococcus vulcanius (strain ATCC 700851 / DSM 12094 / M7) TaxID=579137 RepID=C9RFV1_METVM|nr:hypothetical protein [Methanocaldococcus vulcanius]ACX72453.1 hypothetical protein Metvu_0594 [Methanocaldococcus vulcanius M7]